MRLALLSDVHGNLTALQAVARAIREDHQVQQVIVAGDLLQGGPRPREVWQTLLDLRWTLVGGNEDAALAAGYPPAALSIQPQLAWSQAITGAEIRRAIGALPLEVRLTMPAGDLLVVHSSPRSTNDRAGAPHSSTTEVTDAYSGTGASAIAFGHWHQSFVRPMPFALLLNVASVGLPKSGRPLAAYTVLTASATGWIVEQQQIPYDPVYEEHAAIAVGMPPWRSSA
ncbi:MAG TPA: metallophosphoesterase family protein [Chloroflexota bacterium]|nr:metallophosphoesterase family protein [Chloroflexota bacterium]